MDKKHVWVAIIAGGQGTRLFPISYTDRPKQFCQLDKKNTFIQSAISNFTSLGIKSTQIVVVTTTDNQTRLAKEQTLPRGILSQNIYQIDPGYGYAGAMVKATEFIARLDKDAIVINTPSDQYLAADENFHVTIEQAVKEAKSGHAVIVGVKVNDIVTAMGCGHALYKEDDTACFEVTGFVEKPSMKEADKIMRQGNSACNTGINVWRAKSLLLAVSQNEASGLATDALMEKLGDLKIAVGNFEWHDCGTLKSLYEISTERTPHHKNVNSGGGRFERTDCLRSFFYAGEGMELSVTGARDDAIIFTTIHEKIVLVVAKLEESQRIKSLAEDYLKNQDILTADFSFGGHGNVVMRSNIPPSEMAVGFVGVEGYVVYIHRKADGMLEAAVSQQLTHKKG